MHKRYNSEKNIYFLMDPQFMRKKECMQARRAVPPNKKKSGQILGDILGSCCVFR
jgi:hypothetical protein